MFIISLLIAVTTIALAGTAVCTSDDSDSAAETIALIDSGKN